LRARIPLHVHALICVTLAVVAAGCSGRHDLATRPTLPAAGAEGRDAAPPAGLAGGSDGSGSYPLLLGNRWLDRGIYVVRTVPDSGPEPAPYRNEMTTEREIVCTVQIGHRRYLVEQSIQRMLDRSYTHWVAYRQDDKGLYEGAAYFLGPPPCETGAGPGPAGAPPILARRPAPWPEHLAPRGVATDAAFEAAWQRLRERIASLEEALSPRPASAASLPGMVVSTDVVRLRYPLRTGARWRMRSDPFRVDILVEDIDYLDLPTGRARAYRIRLLEDFLGPNDTVRFWYGAQGQLRYAYHFEMDATDQTGRIIGRAIVDQHESLEAAWLLDKPSRLPPWAPLAHR